MNIDTSLVYMDSVPVKGSPVYSAVLDAGENGGDEVPVPNISNVMMLSILATQAFAGGTSITVAVQTSDTLSGGNLANPVTLESSTLPVANLGAGATFPFRFMPNDLKRYTQLLVTPTGTFTAGALFAAQTCSQGVNIGYGG